MRFSSRASSLHLPYAFVSYQAHRDRHIALRAYGTLPYVCGDREPFLAPFAEDFGCIHRFFVIFLERKHTFRLHLDIGELIYDVRLAIAVASMTVGSPPGIILWVRLGSVPSMTALAYEYLVSLIICNLAHPITDSTGRSTIPYTTP